MTENRKSGLKWIWTRQPTIVCVVGESGVGKTTFIVELVKDLTAKGIRVGTIKHAPKGFSLNDENKDSGRHKSAGARTAIVVAHDEIAFVKDKNNATLDNLREYLYDVDLIIAEGFKDIQQPKIFLSRSNRISSEKTESKKYLVEIVDKNWRRKKMELELGEVGLISKIIQTRYIIGPKKPIREVKGL